MRYTEEDIVNAFNDFMTKMAAGNNMYFITIVTNEIYRGNYVIRISNGCLIDVDQGLKRVNIHAPNIGDLFIDGNSFILDDTPILFKDPVIVNPSDENERATFVEGLKCFVQELRGKK